MKVLESSKRFGLSLALAVLALLGTAAHAAVVNVFAQANSTSGGGTGGSTGVILTAGEFFTATADTDDLWSAGPLPRWSNADGLVVNLFATGSDESGQLAGTLIGQDFGQHNQHGLSLPYGMLVGSIGGNFFAMGTSFAGNAVATGELLLWYWDSNSLDNAQSIRVTISTVPEPPVVALVLLGALGLVLARRRR